MITCLAAFYRPIGCEDEASSDEEQGEKILYFYPEETELPKRLSRITMLEALIEFTGRFSKEPIDVVIMEKQTWAFVQCEPDLWIVAAIENSCPSSSSSNNSSSNLSPLGVTAPSATATNPSAPPRSLPLSAPAGACHRPNGVGFVDALMKMYRTYCLFFGNVIPALRGDGDHGLERVREVQEQRRHIRKLKGKLRQDVLDLGASQKSAQRKAEEERDGEERIGRELQADSPREHLGIRDGVACTADLERQVATTRGLVAAAEQRLADLLSEEDEYTPRSVRRSLGGFLRWYLTTGELLCPSVMHSAAGIHFCPSGHPAFQSLLRVRQAAEDISRSLLRGCLILHDGGVAWSDLDDETTFALFDYVRVKEHESVRGSLQTHLAEQERRYALAGAGAGGVGAGAGSGRGTEVGFAGPAASAAARGGKRSGQGPAPMSGLAAQPHPSDEDLSRAEIDWARRVRARKGFVTGPHWGAVDLEDGLLQPDTDNFHTTAQAGATEGADRASMQTHAWSDPRISDGSRTFSSANGELEAAFASGSEPIMGCFNASTKCIWSPRLFAIDPLVAVEPSAGLSGSPFPAPARARSPRPRADMGMQAGASAPLGRAVVFRQGPFLLAMLLPDWSNAQGGPAFAADHIDKLLRSQGLAAGLGADGPASDPSWARRVGENALLNLCASLERGLAPELEQLARLLKQEAAAAGERSAVGSSSPSRRRSVALPDTVRLLYFNANNRALKVGPRASFARPVELCLLSAVMPIANLSIFPLPPPPSTRPPPLPLAKTRPAACTARARTPS